MMRPGHIRTAEQQNVFLVINVVYAVIFLIEAQCSQNSDALLNVLPNYCLRECACPAFCLESSMKVVVVSEWG